MSIVALSSKTPLRKRGPRRPGWNGTKLTRDGDYRWREYEMLHSARSSAKNRWQNLTSSSFDQPQAHTVSSHSREEFLVDNRFFAGMRASYLVIAWVYVVAILFQVLLIGL